jgi:iron complex transport system permease protein
LRLPEVLLCAITGAILAVSGVLMQGLFRNPIVEPGLIGTSSGAAFGASVVFVLAAKWTPQLKSQLGPFMTPLFAFGGALLATWLVYTLAKKCKTCFNHFIIADRYCCKCDGIKWNRLYELYRKRPAGKKHYILESRNFSGASWLQVSIVGTVAAIMFIISFRYSKQLNALSAW